MFPEKISCVCLHYGKIRESLTKKKVRSLLRQTQDIHQKAILTLLYSLGVRANELCGLKVGDVDIAWLCVYIRQGKG